MKNEIRKVISDFSVKNNIRSTSSLDSELAAWEAIKHVR
jgi:hypothetical protein